MDTTPSEEMNQPLPKKPIELTIDVEQWRRDIKTFADTTTQALDAIAAELSNTCSSNFDGRETKPRAAIGGGQLNPESDTPSRIGVSDLPGEDRLTKLKTQLAQRISKSN